MPKAVIALGADHGGFEAKKSLIAFLRDNDYRVIDTGACDAEASDYPVFAFRVAEAVSRGQAHLGILLCRSGNGMSMAANRVRGVRAALAHTAELARLARTHNDANILIVGADHLTDSPEEILIAFLESEFEGGRHARRVDIIREYDQMLHSALPTHRLVVAGQSPWLDDISDMLLTSGQLDDLLAQGVRGVTSNPSIFEKAINSGEGRYRAELARMKNEGVTPEEAYERLTTDDIRAACDRLRPIYDRTGGDDGYVSLEVLPEYAYDEETSLNEARRLFDLVERPNLMIKIPGTPEGIRAFRRATADGINVNVTLLFSRANYRAVARAYIDGLSDRLRAGKDVSRIRSVASVFVSRIDSAVDQRLEDIGSEAARGLLHHAGIDNTRLIYADFREIFYGGAMNGDLVNGASAAGAPAAIPGDPDSAEAELNAAAAERFAELAAAGAAVQRPLWGSTSTKNPNLPDTLYAEELVGPQTVNTLPLKTLLALIDHGRVRGNTIEEDLTGARRRTKELAALGIDINDVCDQLQRDGVAAFADSFNTLFASISSALAHPARV